MVLVDALFGGPVDDRQIERQNALDIGGQLGALSLLGKGFGGDSVGDECCDHILAHLGHDIGH